MADSPFLEMRSPDLSMMDPKLLLVPKLCERVGDEADVEEMDRETATGAVMTLGDFGHRQLC